MSTTHLKIEGMSCANCVAHTQKALAAVSGVQRVEVDLAAGSATVEHQNADEQKLVAAVAAAGYTAKVA